MENYEKKYKEALEKAKAVLETDLHESGVWAIKKIFPELKESEDERIRKAIREILLDAPAQDLINKDLELEKALAWLEKQKEQKSISAEEILVKAGLKPYKDGNQWCILAGDNIQEGICGFGDTIEDALYEFLKEVLDLQKKQKPVEWSEDFEENIRNLLHDKLTGHSEDGTMTWTTFIDDKTLKDIVSGIWLYVGKEALKYPNKELNVAEWSEEDEKKRNLLIDILEVNHPNGYFKVNPANTLNMEAIHTEELVAWLKSLRPQLREKEESKKVNCPFDKGNCNYCTVQFCGAREENQIETHSTAEPEYYQHFDPDC